MGIKCFPVPIQTTVLTPISTNTIPANQTPFQPAHRNRLRIPWATASRCLTRALANLPENRFDRDEPFPDAKSPGGWL